MEYPLKRYGLSAVEIFFEDLLNYCSWLLILFSLSIVFAFYIRGSSGWSVGLLIAATFITGATFMTGVVLGLAGSGIRQNTQVLQISMTFLFLAAAGWIFIWAFIGLKYGLWIPVLIGIGIAEGILLSIIAFVHRRAIRVRFRPKFFSEIQFETMIQIADTMMETDGNNAVSNVQVALNVDRLLWSVDTPSTETIQSMLFVVEWFLPFFTVLRPFRFSSLGSNVRRRTIEKVINPQGLLAPLLRSIFRDVARGLKMLSCIGYYGDTQGMAQVGYVPFEERPRYDKIDKTPFVFTDPIPKGELK
jgi:hypothetical protein